MPSGDRPILLLDVDGVLNAARWELREGWERGTFHGFVLSWDPTITARLRELHESGRVEIQWLTTWTTDADRLLAEPMGLPRGLKVHDRADAVPTGYSGPAGGLSGWWKLAAAQAVAWSRRTCSRASPTSSSTRSRRGSELPLDALDYLGPLVSDRLEPVHRVLEDLAWLDGRHLVGVGRRGRIVHVVVLHLVRHMPMVPPRREFAAFDGRRRSSGSAARARRG